MPFAPSPAAGTVGPADIEPHALEEAAALLVFADGRFVPGLSNTGRLPPGVQAVSIAAALRTGGADFPVSGIDLLAGDGASGFAALNTAFVEDGAALRIPARTEVEGPVQILYVSTGAGDGPVASFPRTLVGRRGGKQGGGGRVVRRRRSCFRRRFPPHQRGVRDPARTRQPPRALHPPAGGGRGEPRRPAARHRERRQPLHLDQRRPVGPLPAPGTPSPCSPERGSNRR